MDRVVNLCKDAAQYPHNFAWSHDSLEYSLFSYQAQLTSHQKRLFAPDAEAALNFYELDDGATDFWNFCVSNATKLKAHLGTISPTRKIDPRCRFLFMNAIHGISREQLKTTREMLTLAFTYLQVMPEFLDFVFLFGYQIQAEDLYCSGFRHRTRLTGPQNGLEVPERNWSGHDFQVCYSLKSVEQSGAQSDWPWSIRHCALHHGFDSEKIRSTWIIIKGDNLMERRIQSAASDRGPAELSSYATTDRAFTASLATHLLVCSWSVENWRWYIKALEQRFEGLTEAATFIDADAPVSPTKETDFFSPIPRTDTQMTHKSFLTAKSRVSSFRDTLRGRTKTSDSIATTIQNVDTSPRMYTNASGKSQPMPPGKKVNASRTITTPVDEFGQRVFSFKDLQHVQNIEELANEAVLVMKLNMNVIQQLKKYYISIKDSHELPATIVDKCKCDMLRFERRLDGIVQDFELQILRVEALLRLLSDRKTLLYGLLEFQNTQANKQLAMLSRVSTENMEHMTRDMRELTRKTKTETVSMRLITFVTLVFLPGTFISVGLFIFFCSTFMSTDVLHWNDNESVFQSAALITYLYISLPFTVVVLIFWAAMQLREKNKEKKRANAEDEKLKHAEP